jgi:hypothetical protein
MDIPPEAKEEARRHPNGYVYVIVGSFSPEEDVPPEAIMGAWKVDENGQIVGEFISNPKYHSGYRKGGSVK